MNMKQVLFLNHTEQTCGVYQYGIRIYDILKQSSLVSYIYCEIKNYDEYIMCLSLHQHSKIIYNYHVVTMHWLNSANIQKIVKNIAIPHESDYSMFDIILNINPAEPERLNYYSIPRPIYENVNNLIDNCKIENIEIANFINYKKEDTPIFGSFGFGFDNKGFDKIVKVVNRYCNRAIIKFIITTPHFSENSIETTIANVIKNLHSHNTNPNIEILISRNFFKNEEVLKFLSSNTANIFMYDKMPGRGISSVIDYALSANVPIVISDSYMFRHIYSDDICIYKNNLIDCINNSKRLLPLFLSRYSNKNLIEKIDSIVTDNYEICNSTSIQNCKVEVSIGEIVDKYSILDLKTKYIKDPAKLIEINKEMKTLGESVDVKKYPYFYKLLLHINELIWLDTDVIKGLTLDNVQLFAETSNQIFENNQKRFRLKNYFNIFQDSNIKEQKSYNQTNCFIKISDEEDIYNKIPELNYLFISYDVVHICIDYAEIINKIFTNPNIKFVSSLYPNDNAVDVFKEYTISSFSIPSNIKEVYDYEPIKYISAGRLGDFLNQLSVICEIFYETGHKGLLYIVDKDFTYKIEHTYMDTYETIVNQKYIKGYQMYKGEKYDIDLSYWRRNYNVSQTFKQIFDNNYKIDWAKHTWLTAKFDDKWANKTIIYITPYRFLSKNALQKLKNVGINNEEFVFITTDVQHYEYFIQKTGFSIGCYVTNTFDELVTIINSCKFAYLGMTSFAVVANSLKKKHILIGNPGPDYNYNKFLGILPNVVDEFV
jgi:hypothetical protein